MHKINRRDFIKNLSLATMGTALLPTLSNLSLKKTLKIGSKSRVAIIRDPKASSNKGQTIDPEIIQNMMDTAIRGLSGQKNVADAYASLFPKREKTDIIAIKVNCMHTHAFTESCHKTIDAIVTGLKGAGIDENNIILYDWKNEDLSSCGYTRNTDTTGVRCFGNDEKGKS